MSEYQQQKKTKPPLQETAEKYLTGDKLAALLDFADFLRKNKMTPQWASTNSYAVSHRSRRVCILKIARGSYQLWLNTQYNDDFNAAFADESQATRDWLIHSVVVCFGCGSCKPGQHIDILNTPFENACFNPVLRMTDPSPEQIIVAKKLVLLRKQAIANGKAPKITYIAMSKR